MCIGFPSFSLMENCKMLTIVNSFWYILIFVKNSAKYFPATIFANCEFFIHFHWKLLSPRTNNVKNDSLKQASGLWWNHESIAKTSKRPVVWMCRICGIFVGIGTLDVFTCKCLLHVITCNVTCKTCNKCWFTHLVCKKCFSGTPFFWSTYR